MSARAAEIVYTVTLTAAQRLEAVHALQARRRYLKTRTLGVDADFDARVDDCRQANSEALRIIGEAPEVELDASGEPV